MNGAQVLEQLFGDDIDHLRGRRLRMVRLRIPGKEVCLAHILTPTDPSIYENLGLTIGVHQGEDHRGEAIGILRFTPWEAVAAAADLAVKSAEVDIGFMDRFCGCLILTGGLSQVETAVREVVGFFHKELGFHVCEIHKS